MTPPIPTPLRITALWLFTVLTMLFRDVHELTEAATAREILQGTMNGTPVTDALLLVGMALVTLPLAVMTLTILVPGSALRWLNLIVAPLTMVGGVAAGPRDPDDFAFLAVQVVALSSLMVLAWRWNPLELLPSAATPSAAGPESR